MNRQTGIIDKTISIEAKNFMINSKDEIILIGSDNKEIFYYYFIGEKLFELKLVNFPVNLSSFFDFNDEIGFYETENFNILYRS